MADSMNPTEVNHMIKLDMNYINILLQITHVNKMLEYVYK